MRRSVFVTRKQATTIWHQSGQFNDNSVLGKQKNKIKQKSFNENSTPKKKCPQFGAVQTAKNTKTKGHIGHFYPESKIGSNCTGEQIVFKRMINYPLANNYRFVKLMNIFILLSHHQIK